MEMFYAFGFIALIAAVFKIIILYQVVTYSKLSSALNLLILALIVQNCFEFLGYFTWTKDPALSSRMVDGVFLGYFAVSSAAILLIMRVSELRYGKLIAGLFAGSGLIMAVMLSQGLITTAYVQTGYTIVPEHGSYYSLFSLYILSVLAVAMGTLGWASLKASRKIKDRCRVTLIAISPMIAVSFGVIILKQFGFASSTALLTPLASTLFVWVLMVDERGDFLRMKIKWVILMKLALNTKDISLNNWTNLVEKMLVLEAMRGTSNNKSEAARLVGVNKTTFHRKAERHISEPAYEPTDIALQPAE